MKKLKQYSFEKTPTLLDLPSLLDLQLESYKNFLQREEDNSERKIQGIQAAFLDAFPISSEDESLCLEFVSYSVGDTNYSSPFEALEFDKSFTVPIRILLRLVHKQTGGKVKVISEQEVFLCDLPYMTDTASFVINGAQRVIVSQLHRSPGIIFEEDDERKVSKFGKNLYVGRIIPYRGAWLDFEFDLNNVLYARIDKRRKMPATILLRICGLETDEDILSFFYESENAKLTETTKYETLYGRILCKDVIDASSGEVVIEAGEKITSDNSGKIAKSKAKEITLLKLDEASDVTIIETLRKDTVKSRKEALHFLYKYIRGQEFVIPSQAEEIMENLFFGKKTKKYDLTNVGRFKIMKKLGHVFQYLASLKGHGFRSPGETRRELSPEDIIATVYYLILLNNGKTEWTFGSKTIKIEVDDIDHLGNRRVRAVGELLKNQFTLAFTQMTRVIRDRMVQAQEKAELTPRQLVNTSVLNGILRNFFGSSQLSQFMDQVNPLSELTHKRRLSALGPGGLHRKHAGFEVRDVHHTHYGRICPIETPEGPNIGLITSLACYARVNQYGLIETPYRQVEGDSVSKKCKYLTANDEDELIIAQANASVDDKGRFKDVTVSCRHKGEFPHVEKKKVDYMDISPTQVFGISTSLIPFLENDDANRALMGANMQRQAVPLLITEYPLVSTGVEKNIVKDLGVSLVAARAGRVLYVSGDEVVVKTDDSKNPLDVYPLHVFKRSNQDTAITYVPIVSSGDKVSIGTPIADGPGVSQGQLALGKNVLTAFMPWEGYNFEDAILVSDRLVKDDTFTSIHVQELEIEARETKLGPEEITRDIPNVSAEALANLDENGIVVVGTEVNHGDVLVGRVIPRGEEHLTPEEKLLRVIFGKKAEDVQDASLRVPPGVKGKVKDVQVFVRREVISQSDRERMRKELDEFIKGSIKDLDTYAQESKAALDTKKKEGEITTSEYNDRKAGIALFCERKKKDLQRRKEKDRTRIDRGHEVAVMVNRVVKVFIATKRPLMVGDKMAGRHGNKGVVSKILPTEDMPRLPDGTPIDVVFSPLSVPSRMNIGQLLETMLGWVAYVNDCQMITPVFNGATEDEIIKHVKMAKEMLKKKGIPEDYLPTDDMRITLFDGRTGKPFEEKVTMGYMYVMKLVHLVEDKIHARSTGPYSLITRQPLGGKALFGGQRFGEMEVWAIEAFGASHILQEFLTVKSDDVWGRTKMYESIVKGEAPIKPGIPESFKVLVRELQGLGLNIELLKNTVDSEADINAKATGKSKKTGSADKAKV
ncbi:DNA-directed RNA polymerase subunit beta [Elusimicrobiota bacterium]